MCRLCMIHAGTIFSLACPFVSWGDIHTHPYTTAACAAGVVTKTTDRDSLRYTYNGTQRVRQLVLGCESN